MRTAAMPTFRKLYRKLASNGSGSFSTGLPAGTYRLTIGYSEWLSLLTRHRRGAVHLPSRLSRVKFLGSKTIHHQHDIVDGREESLSRLGLHRRGHCVHDCICGLLHSPQNMETVRSHRSSLLLDRLSNCVAVTMTRLSRCEHA